MNTPEKGTVAYELDQMLKIDQVLYEKILDTKGFAFHFNNICLIAQKSEVSEPAQVKPDYKRLREELKKLLASETKESLEIWLKEVDRMESVAPQEPYRLERKTEDGTIGTEFGAQEPKQDVNQELLEAVKKYRQFLINEDFLGEVAEIDDLITRAENKSTT